VTYCLFIIYMDKALHHCLDVVVVWILTKSSSGDMSRQYIYLKGVTLYFFWWKHGARHVAFCTHDFLATTTSKYNCSCCVYGCLFSRN
jgi:hypothetical protein